MKKIQFSAVDVQPINTKREMTDEGYLKAVSGITTVGIQYYSDIQLGVGREGKMLAVYRPAETVFHKDTINSARMKPITLEHPTTDVTADNYKDLSVGMIGETVEALDSLRLGAKIIINDPAIIKQIEDGLVETSAGYNAMIIEDSGEYEGEQYDYRFDGPMIINHLAIVDKGRCGPGIKILDKGMNMTKEQIMAIMAKQGFVDSAEADKFSDEMTLDDVIMMMMKMMPAMMMMMQEEMEDGEYYDDSAENQDEKASEESKDAEEDKGEQAEEKAEEQEDETDEESEESESEDAAKDDSVQDAAESDKSFNDSVKARVKLLTDAAELITDLQDVDSKSDRDILEHALKDTVKDVKSKSDEYLRGTLDVILSDRKQAKEELNNIKDSSAAKVMGAKEFNFLDIQNMK